MLQLVLLISALALAGAAACLVLWGSVAKARALERARAIAAMVEAVGSWASQYRGVWVLNDPTDPPLEVGEFLDHKQARAADPTGPAGREATSGDPHGSVDIAHTRATFHRKVPSLVQREVAEVMSGLVAGARFRVTNDRHFDARNAPDSFERDAIAQLRTAGMPSTTNAEYHRTDGGQLLYARRLVAAETCVRCHDTPARSPPAMRAKFDGSGGWGMRPGHFGGIVSVSVPLLAHESDGFGKLWVDGVRSCGRFHRCHRPLLCWLQWSVVRPAARLAAYAESVLEAQLGGAVARIELDSDEPSSGNEMHELSLAIQDLHRALRIGAWRT